MSDTKKQALMLVQKSGNSLIPKVALFSNGGSSLHGSLFIQSTELAMCRFKMSVELDTAIASVVHPYDNGIGLRRDSGELMLVEQQDHFVLDCPTHGMTVECYIYLVDESVSVQAVCGRPVIEWANIGRLNELYERSHAGIIDALIVKRALYQLSRPNWPEAFEG